MRALYDFVTDHIVPISVLLIALTIPTVFFPKLTVILIILLAFLNILVCHGGLKGWCFTEDGYTEPCRFCDQHYGLPEETGTNGFAIVENLMCYDDPRRGWVSIAIDYCPICGRELRGEYES